MNQYANNAVDRYLKELRRALCSAPKKAQEAALSDAAEFLRDEMSALGVEQMDATETHHAVASDHQAYDHFVDCYGSPRDVAAEYLQTWNSMSEKTKVPTDRPYFAIVAIGLVATAAFFGLEQFRSPRTFSPLNQIDLDGGRMPPKISPFTQVEFQGDKIMVEYEHARYEWLGIDDIPVSKVAASSQQRYRDLWRKRITEDLVEVLWAMGHVPGNTVKLHLNDAEENIETTIAAAPMTRANRQAMYGNYPVSVVRPLD